MSTQHELKGLQRMIDDDKSVRDNYVNADDSESSSDDSDSDVEQVVSSRIKRKKKRNSTEAMLMERFLEQQNTLLKGRDKVNKYKRELTVEETNHRYTKLELNNKTVELDEKKVKLRENKRLMISMKMEMLFMRFLVPILTFFCIKFYLYSC